MTCIQHGRVNAEEMHHFLEGCRRFDLGRHWDSHESWEDLWNLLKKRKNFSRRKLFKALIQTRHLLYNYGRQKKRGVELGWLKLEKSSLRFQPINTSISVSI